MSKKMKLTKKLITVSLCALMLGAASAAMSQTAPALAEDMFSLTVSAAQDEDPESVYNYEENDDGTIKLKYYWGSNTDVTVPAEIDGKSVTAVEGIFSQNTSIKSVTLPESVTDIGDYSFYNCSALESVSIGSSVRNIGYAAFSGCSSLQSAVLPDSVETIGNFAFYQCTGMRLARMGSGTKTMGYSVFSGCTALREITLPAALETMDEYSFYQCSSLESIVIPDKVTDMGKYTFCECTSLKSVKLGSSMKKISYEMFGDCTAIEKITIPSSVKTIEDFAFYNCTALKTAEIPSTVTKIEEYAFSGCSKLTIYGKLGSAAEKFAAASGIKFVDPSYIKLKEIKLNKKSVTLTKGKTVTLKATISPSNATNKTLKWKSDNTKVAAVSSSGKVTAKKGGTAVITVTGADGKSASCKVTVNIPSTKVKLSKTKAGMKKGDDLTLKATMTPSDSTDKLTWTSSDKKIATVKNGVVTAKKAGDVTITVKTTSRKTAKCKLTITTTYVEMAVNGKYYTNINAALKRINAIRYEACKEGVANPSDPSKKLTLKDYKPLKWSSELEKVARQRAAEAVIRIDHTRPNDLSCWSIDVPFASGGGEVLAWNFTTDMVYGIDQFYAEKYDWVHNTGGVTGHYTIMIDPAMRYVGLGGFYSQKDGVYPSCLCGRFSSTSDKLDGTKGKATKVKNVNVEVSTRFIKSLKLSRTDGKANTIKKGKSAQYKLTAGVKIDGHAMKLPCTKDLKWTSSDTKIATVKNGKVTAKKAGTVTITVKTTSGKTAKCRITIKK